MQTKIRQILVCFIVPAVLLAGLTAYGADYANPQLLVTPAAVEKNAGKWVVIDCRDEKAYAAGHIPGAISLGGACGKVLRDATLRVKKSDDLEKLLGAAGVTMERPVVVYADAKLITSASVAFWALELLGHEKVHFLNGGIEAWQEAKKALDTTETKVPAATFKANFMKSRIASTDEMIKIAKGEVKDASVIDSRTEKEHKGADIRSLRGGHIPNTSMNVSHLDTYDAQAGKIHSMDELEKIFGRLEKGKRTIAYCQTGTRSTLTYLELRLMGFKEPANYDDSWIVYGSNPDCPVASENWYDFVKANETIKAVEELKKEVEELKKR